MSRVRFGDPVACRLEPQGVTHASCLGGGGMAPPEDAVRRCDTWQPERIHPSRGAALDRSSPGATRLARVVTVFVAAACSSACGARTELAESRLVDASASDRAPVGAPNACASPPPEGGGLVDGGGAGFQSGNVYVAPLTDPIDPIVAGRRDPYLLRGTVISRTRLPATDRFNPVLWDISGASRDLWNAGITLSEAGPVALQPFAPRVITMSVRVPAGAVSARLSLRAASADNSLQSIASAADLITGAAPDGVRPPRARPAAIHPGPVAGRGQPPRRHRLRGTHPATERQQRDPVRVQLPHQRRERRGQLPLPRPVGRPDGALDAGRADPHRAGRRPRQRASLQGADHQLSARRHQHRVVRRRLCGEVRRRGDGADAVEIWCAFRSSVANRTSRRPVA